MRERLKASIGQMWDILIAVFDEFTVNFCNLLAIIQKNLYDNKRNFYKEGKNICRLFC